MKNEIGKQVKVNCPVYHNGRTFYGTITGKKKEGTFFVKLAGNQKATSFSSLWVSIIESL